MHTLYLITNYTSKAKGARFQVLPKILLLLVLSKNSSQEIYVRLDRNYLQALTSH